jgi:hypothetical protein
MQFWSQLQGKSLADAFPLNALLRAESSHAWFITRYRQRSATVFVAKAIESDHCLLANLRAASRIRHPNIVQIERVGRTRIDGISVVYAVLEPTEENLAEVLRERCLTPEETAQITESLVAALSTLQQHGLLHGRIHPANVFAAGEAIKLRSDCVFRLTAGKAPAGVKDLAAVYGQDIGDLGALVFECLTQRPLTSPNDPAIATLPPPFRSIVQKAVSGRWGLTDISAALKRPSPGPRHPVPAPAKGELVRAGRPAKPKSAPASFDPRLLDPRPVDPRPLDPPPLEVRLSAPVIANRRKRRSPVFLFTPIALVAVICVGWYFNHGAEEDAVGQSSVRAAVVALPTPSAVDLPEVQALPPDPTGEARNVWRVVAFAFADEQEAQQKVDGILRTHPELRPEVFTVNGFSPYLVTLGGRMSRPDAVKLRSQIDSDGMPADAYVQNYSH